VPNTGAGPLSDGHDAVLDAGDFLAISWRFPSDFLAIPMFIRRLARESANPLHACP